MTTQSREAFDREELKRLISEALKFDLTKLQPAIWLELRLALDYAEGSVQAALSEGRRQGLEEAQKICRANFEECTSRTNCHLKDEAEIRALIVGGGEV